MDNAIAVSDGLNEQQLHITGGGLQALVLCQDAKPTAPERAIKDFSPFLEINRGGTEKDGGGGHGNVRVLNQGYFERDRDFEAESLQIFVELHLSLNRILFASGDKFPEFF